MEDRTPRPYASSDEDFEMVPDANGAKDTLTLTAAAELSHVPTTNARATVACNITAAASEGKRRPDVDVVVVMDRSGSMEAERKLELCKETTELLIEQLRPSDRFGLVSFDNQVKEELPLTPMDADGKSNATKIVEKLRPGGATNLSGALLQDAAEARVHAAAHTPQQHPVAKLARLVLGHDLLKVLAERRVLPLVLLDHPARHPLT